MRLCQEGCEEFFGLSEVDAHFSKNHHHHHHHHHHHYWLVPLMGRGVTHSNINLREVDSWPCRLLHAVSIMLFVQQRMEKEKQMGNQLSQVHLEKWPIKQHLCVSCEDSNKQTDRDIQRHRNTHKHIHRQTEIR